ncbi:hypothetical protein [Asaia bogorensis]|uniref:hypothetical protein n=1 Tax=Asaia bogorensis TaxID=91915 RepID=UPI00285DFAED|nr:hypothetical protein [Asaia bogorensis]MDR6182025.1 putative membrane protein [Asaia bogorensis NBRC 16594]
MPKSQIPALVLFALCLLIVSLRAMEIEIEYGTEAMLYMSAFLLGLACVAQLSLRLFKAHRLRRRY